MKKRFFISNAIDEEKLPFMATAGMKFGRAHYSWKIIANLYEQGLEAAGMETHRVIRPEIYQSKIAQNIFGVRHDDTHIAVKPIEHIRSFPGMRNIFISGWEFPQLSNKSYEGSPLNDHVNVLRHADCVWCWSTFTANNLKTHGINTAITMPPPVIITEVLNESNINNLNTLALNTKQAPTLNDVRSLSDVLNRYKNSTVFFSVLNPFDKRKQLKLMLTAFQMALAEHRDIFLIIKLVIDNVSTTLGNIQELLKIHHDFHGESDRIIFVSETLTDGQMKKLMRKAHFYLCTSSTEGLNLPMIEAMSQGVVPVSSRATAMADYVNKENAIVIESDESLTDGSYHALHKYLPTTHFPPRLSSTIQALTCASSLSAENYKTMSDHAKKDVHEKYSLQAFIAKLMGQGQ
jgi:glycosyltransferase involved in cell wall biosynthesis